MNPEFINAAALEDARVAFSTVFDRALEGFRKVEEQWMQLAMMVTSTGESEEHKWMGDVPAFEKWAGERKIGKVSADNYRIRNEDWANGIEVHQNDIDDDKLGLYAPRIQRLASKAVVHKINLMVSFLANGFATTTHGACYTGSAFFATNHDAGNGYTFSNMLTATLDDSGAYDSAWEKLLSMVDESNEPWGAGISRPVLIVGPSNRAKAREILLATQGSSGASNTNYGTAELFVSSKLVGSHAAKWFLADLGDQAKPLIYQERRAISFDSVEKGENYFKTRKLLFGASGRYNIGYGFPQTIIGSDGTT